MKTYRLAVTFFLTFGTVMNAWAEQFEFSSGPSRTHLIELFTSEGCSSCPPAEKWVNSLKSDPGLWREFVPAAFHVDYWDRLGWKDRFADNNYTERQFNYRQAGLISSVYTPGFVLNGREYRQWFGIRKLPLADPEPAGTLRVSMDSAGNVSFSYDPRGSVDNTLTFNAAVLGFGIKTEVKAGENRGKTLDHEFVVLNLGSRQLEPDGNGTFNGTMKLDLANTHSSDLALAAWVSSLPVSEIQQATGGWISR